MKLKEFVEKFIEPNSLVRLLYKTNDGHMIVGKDWNSVCMEHDILYQKGKFRHYINNEVIGIASILIYGPYSESINIVIEKLENQPYLDEVEYESICESNCY